MKRLALFALILCAWLCVPAYAQFNGCYGFCGTSSSAVVDGPGFNNRQGTGSGSTCCVLDGITTGIKAAYSTRKLLTAYAGNAIQVQETTGNTTSNIGFVANVLDTATLSTFCSGKTCKVITWYDQSGGGFNLTQATIANAPIIFQSGAVNAINTKPAILFVNANNTELVNASLSADPTNTLYQNSVSSYNTTAPNGITFGADTSGGYDTQFTTSTGIFQLVQANVVVIATSSSGVSSGVGAVVETQYNSSTGVFSLWLNRASVGTGTNAKTLTAATTIIGANFLSFQGPFDGSIGEMIQYDLVGGIPGASQTSIENNQKAYWGTP